MTKQQQAVFSGLLFAMLLAGCSSTPKIVKGYNNTSTAPVARFIADHIVTIERIDGKEKSLDGVAYKGLKGNYRITLEPGYHTVDFTWRVSENQGTQILNRFSIGTVTGGFYCGAGQTCYMHLDVETQGKKQWRWWVEPVQFD